MFIPEGCDCELDLPSSSEPVNSLVANRDHSVFVVATNNFLYFYLADTRLLACSFQRDQQQQEDDDNSASGERGFFKRVYWKPDSTAISVTTSSNFVNIYSVEIDRSSSSFNLHDSIASGVGASFPSEFARDSTELFVNRKRPRISVNLSVVARLESTPTCVLTFKEELILCLADGWLHRLSWSGNILSELSFNIRSLHSDQQQHSKNLHRHADRHFVSDISPFLGGICVVLNDGRAALLVSNSAEFRPDTINMLFAVGLKDAHCCSTNFKFRLIYFGCTNGEIAAYSLNDLNDGLVQLFRIKLSVKDGNEYLERLASVRQINCLSPSGNAFAVLWDYNSEAMLMLNNNNNNGGRNGDIVVGVVENGSENASKTTTDSPMLSIASTKNGSVGGGSLFLRNCCYSTKYYPPALAIFSPFGEQWWCSLEDVAVTSSGNPLESCQLFVNCEYTSMDWSQEGYQLWLGTSTSRVHLINLVRSPHNSHDALMLIGADRVFVSPTNLSNSQSSSACCAPHLIWKLIKPPHNYIALNWPIKHVAISRNAEKIIAVGGTHGFCFFNFKTAKWRMFRKEAQEKSLLLTGGLVLVEGFIICSACNLDVKSSESERIYVFRLDDHQLDTDLAHYIQTSKILQIKLSGSYLLTFDVDSMINIYSLLVEFDAKKKRTTLEMECIAEIRIAEFLYHPNCLISMELTKLDFHSDALPFCGELDSLLINTSGQLLLLSPMQQQMNGGQEKNNNNNSSSNNSQNSVAEFQLHPPTLVASYVEEFWTMHPFGFGSEQQQQQKTTNPRISYLSDALWINAGCKKTRIWMPLSPDMRNGKVLRDGEKPPLTQQNSRTFISRRIMLPFNLGIYAFFIDQNYLACGALSNSLHFAASNAPTTITSTAAAAADDVSLTSRFTEDDSLSDFVALEKIYENVALSVHSLARTTEVFIHKLLKQLLKRNLGSYAFELASACRSISYFGHILELLLHDILDEEAASSEPIPDPLLPRVVSFLREFPDEYLQTIVHCARKTELAFWNVLFLVSNHPRQLFQMCLEQGRLDLATSCLVILHSVISIAESSKLASQLLEEAQNKRRWSVAREINRFMQNINRATERDSLDLESSPSSPIQGKLVSLPHHHHHPHTVSPFNSSNEELGFPLFNSQIELEPSASSTTHYSSFAQQQRKRSGSGKTTATHQNAAHLKHITAHTKLL